MSPVPYPLIPCRFFHVIAVLVTLAVQWMENVSEIYAQALALKEQDECGDVGSKSVGKK